MYLGDFWTTAEGRQRRKELRSATTYTAFYNYWREMLFERCMRLFVWDGTGPVPPKEIEGRLILSGHCGVINYKNELTAVWGGFYGPTKYYDEWTGYTWRSPVASGQKKIGKDIAVIDANSLRNPVYTLIHHYACLLAHAEVTLTNTLVNARDSGGVPVAGTEKQKQSITEYLGKLYNGEFGQMTDKGLLGLQYIGSDRHTQQGVLDIFDVRQRLLKAFYSDIGVRSAMEKRSNTIQEEVEADTGLLLLNLSDMLKKRQEGAEKVNKMFGTSWTVKVADEINYTAENAVKEAPENDSVKDGE